MKKKTLGITLALLLINLATWACPVCEKQQPKLLQGISHGAGPQSNWDYVIIISITLIALAALFYSVKWLIRPGEKSSQHIKYLILNQE